MVELLHTHKNKSGKINRENQHNKLNKQMTQRLMIIMKRKHIDKTYTDTPKHAQTGHLSNHPMISGATNHRADLQTLDILQTSFRSTPGDYDGAQDGLRTGVHLMQACVQEDSRK